MQTEKQLRGAIGEQAAVEYLRQNGFMIVERNYRIGRSEVDIIATRYDELHFVEVKTRKADGLSHPFESITPSKRAKVIKTAQFYLMRYPSKLQPRFDAAAVFTKDGELQKIEYIENAFY